MIIADLTNIPEDTEKYYAEEFSPSFSDSMVLSVQVDQTNMTQDAGTFHVLGSNVSKNEDDMVAVVAEDGDNSPTSINSAFVKEFFPYKYMGIKYDPQGNDGDGTLSILIEKRVRRVNIA